ncbi:MAG: YeeE/YedE family protein, partial [Desulfohalobiaceae bacterium]|nr:YeeE/YedE family protein [Desulfohalobiaceae bacterium]
MLENLRTHRPFQLFIGFVIGICFGFFLQKGQVTKYDAIVGQLLLLDFTVLKVMLTAILTGMIGFYVMRAKGLVSFEIKSGSWGSSGIGGLIFGAGMAILGYCPGTTTGATGQGSLDALV